MGSAPPFSGSSFTCKLKVFTLDHSPRPPVSPSLLISSFVPNAHVTPNLSPLGTAVHAITSPPPERGPWVLRNLKREF